MLKAALAYAGAAVKIFSCHWPIDGECSCGEVKRESVGKNPRTAHRLLDATGDAVRIRSYWEWYPSANMGIPTGDGSGLDVVDIEPRHGGWESLSIIEERWEPRSARRCARIEWAGVSLEGGGAGLIVAPPEWAGALQQRGRA